MRVSIVVAVSLVSIAASVAFSSDPGSEGDGDHRISPPYSDAPEVAVKEGVPKGTVHEFTMSSADSKIYPGLKGPYERKAWVYVPSQYVAGTAAPFIVIQDGKNYIGWIPKILDNMIHEHRLPVMIAVLLNSGGGDGKGSERGLEYDTVSDQYTMFIENEVLPKIEKDYDVKFTKDPEGRATMGGSSGGACALTMAWFHPELYRRVLTYSGTYVNQQSPEDPKLPHGAWEYHEHLIPESERKLIRIWLEVGEKDNGANAAESTFHNWVMANERMAKVLKEKGYHYQYVFAEAGKHTDKAVTGQTLPGALEWLWRGYEAKP